VSRPDSETTERIRRHVECLAGGIGERNVFRPAALSAAREYIAAEWRQQGYQVCQQWYEAAGQSCANLEAARPGSTWAEADPGRRRPLRYGARQPWRRR
jgi:hypothetical protein